VKKSRTSAREADLRALDQDALEHVSGGVDNLRGNNTNDRKGGRYLAMSPF